jgi:hypothetical protein
MCRQGNKRYVDWALPHIIRRHKYGDIWLSSGGKDPKAPPKTFKQGVNVLELAQYLEPKILARLHKQAPTLTDVPAGLKKDNLWRVKFRKEELPQQFRQYLRDDQKGIKVVMRFTWGPLQGRSVPQGGAVQVSRRVFVVTMFPYT